MCDGGPITTAVGLSLSPARVRDERARLCEATLERQGKAGQQKALQDTLERLRKASKAEVVPLLPLLEQQVAEMATVSDLDPLLISQVGGWVGGSVSRVVWLAAPVQPRPGSRVCALAGPRARQRVPWLGRRRGTR